MNVHHKVFGVGSVKRISDSIIEVDFSGQIKKFQFPKAFALFLTTDDPVLKEKVLIANKKAEDATNKLQETIRQSPTPQSNITQTINYSMKRNISSPLVGDRAQTIAVRSEAEMFELVGYMATPGRVSSIEAEVPKDGRDETFEKLFPGQTYRPIEMSYTPSGLPNKLSPQFRINFSNIRNCPEPLRRNMGKGNSSCVGRINKSKFVLDIVQNYGFRFGDQQDVSAIRLKAEKRGFLNEFETGYKR